MNIDSGATTTMTTADDTINIAAKAAAIFKNDGSVNNDIYKYSNGRRY